MNKFQSVILFQNKISRNAVCDVVNEEDRSKQLVIYALKEEGELAIKVSSGFDALGENPRVDA